MVAARNAIPGSHLFSRGRSPYTFIVAGFVLLCSYVLWSPLVGRNDQSQVVLERLAPIALAGFHILAVREHVTGGLDVPRRAVPADHWVLYPTSDDRLIPRLELGSVGDLDVVADVD